MLAESLHKTKLMKEPTVNVVRDSECLSCKTGNQSQTTYARSAAFENVMFRPSRKEKMENERAPYKQYWGLSRYKRRWRVRGIIRLNQEWIEYSMINFEGHRVEDLIRFSPRFRGTSLVHRSSPSEIGRGALTPRNMKAKLLHVPLPPTQTPS